MRIHSGCLWYALRDLPYFSVVIAKFQTQNAVLIHNVKIEKQNQKPKLILYKSTENITNSVTESSCLNKRYKRPVILTVRNKWTSNLKKEMRNKTNEILQQVISWHWRIKKLYIAYDKRKPHPRKINKHENQKQIQEIQTFWWELWRVLCFRPYLV